jgi:hypothetical protein
MYQWEKREKANLGATFHMIGYASNEGLSEKDKQSGMF